jgi:predicted GIY-YIG superfamily endonuclease
MKAGEKIPSYPCCYLLELAQPLGNEKHQARYYLGSCANLKKRFQQHLQGVGAAFTRAAIKRGIEFKIVHIWKTSSKQEARQLEIQLKRYKNHAQLLRRAQNVQANQIKSR